MEEVDVSVVVKPAGVGLGLVGSVHVEVMKVFVLVMKVFVLVTKVFVLVMKVFLLVIKAFVIVDLMVSCWEGVMPVELGLGLMQLVGKKIVVVVYLNSKVTSSMNKDIPVLIYYFRSI